MASKSSPRPWMVKRAVGVAVVVLAAIAVYGSGVLSSNPESKTGLPKELTVKSLTVQADQPETMRTTFRDIIRRDDLTDDQKREAARNMRTVWVQQMQSRMDEYFNAPEEEKNAVLDKQIDEFTEMRKRWEQRREEMENDEESHEAMRNLIGPRSTEERKARSESRSPDQMMKMVTYFQTMRSRASERGIELPRWGRGHGGGDQGNRRRGP